MEITNIKKYEFALSTLNRDIGSVLKAFGKYATNHIALGQYEVNNRLFKPKQ